MSATKTIIISTPKYIKAEPAFEVSLDSGNPLMKANIQKSHHIKRSFHCISTMEKITCPPLAASMLNIEATSPLPSPCPSKKRRLDHLSMEEKIQRKKMKNRIAAQSSRDRKKARMDDLELEVNELKEKNRLLSERCVRLEAESVRMADENKQLREQLSQTRVGCKPSAATGPAESWASDPPQQGQGSQPALGLTLLTLLLMTLSHHCPTSWMKSMVMTSSPNLKSWQTASSKKLLQILSTMKESRRFQEEILQESVMLKWWGRHQKTWNPVELQ